MVQLTKSDLHGCQSLDPGESMFNISFLCGIVVLIVQRWWNYVFNHCVGERFFFGGGTLAWVLSSRSRQDINKL